MYQFDYQRPETLAEAKGLLDDGAQLIAGGMTLLPTMKLRLAMPTTLVDLSALKELIGIRQDGDRLVVGAMSCHDEVARSATVAEAIPALAQLASVIGDAQVRNRGTIGGSISNADPAADYPAAVVGLNAIVHTDQRAIAGDEFFTGLFETALQPNEIVTHVEFSVPSRAGYAKFPNPASRYAVVGVFVAEFGSQVRVAVTGAGPSAFRVAEMEQALSADFSPTAIENISVPADNLNADLHASAEYRAHLVTIMAKRAVAAALGD